MKNTIGTNGFANPAILTYIQNIAFLLFTYRIMDSIIPIKNTYNHILNTNTFK